MKREAAMSHESHGPTRQWSMTTTLGQEELSINNPNNRLAKSLLLASIDAIAAYSRAQSTAIVYLLIEQVQEFKLAPKCNILMHINPLISA